MAEDNAYWVKGDFTHEDIGGMVEDIRTTHLELSQEQMSSDLDMKLPTLKNYEKGKMKPGISLIDKVCDRYGLEATLRIEPKPIDS